MKDKSKRIIIIISVGFNICLLLLLAIMFYKNWNFVDIKNKTISVFSQKEESTISSYYIEKTDQFTNLNIDSKSIVFVGDSITDMGEWSEILNNPNVKNRGINGDTIKGVLDRIGDIAKDKPKSIFLMIGTNDINSSMDLTSLCTKYDKILKSIKETSPNTKIYVQSVLPVNSTNWANDSKNGLTKRTENNNDIKLFNAKIEGIAKDNDSTYINLHDSFTNNEGNLSMELTDEGLHINGEGYMIWKQNIEKYINE